jgi:hypothetical protein
MPAYLETSNSAGSAPMSRPIIDRRARRLRVQANGSIGRTAADWSYSCRAQTGHLPHTPSLAPSTRTPVRPVAQDPTIGTDSRGIYLPRVINASRPQAGRQFCSAKLTPCGRNHLMARKSAAFGERNPLAKVGKVGWSCFTSLFGRFQINIRFIMFLGRETQCSQASST